MSLSQKPIKLAIIGASQIAAKVVPYIRKVPHIEIVGVASTNTIRAMEFSEKQGINKIFTSYAEAFSDANVDAVYISTLNSDHFPLIKEALLHNKHVLCEKPMVLTASHASEVTKLAQQRNLILLEGFMYRFHPHIKFLKEAVSNGSLGEIRSLNLSFSFIMDLADTRRGTRSSGGGATNDLGCYLIDFAALILKEKTKPIVLATGLLDQSSSESVDSSVCAILKYPSGRMVQLSASNNQTGANFWEISGTKASMGLFRFDPQGYSNNKDSTVVIKTDEDSNATILPFDPIEESLDQFRVEFQNFADAITGKDKPFISTEEMLINSAILEEIRKQVYQSHK